VLQGFVNPNKHRPIFFTIKFLSRLYALIKRWNSVIIGKVPINLTFSTIAKKSFSIRGVSSILYKKHLQLDFIKPTKRSIKAETLWPQNPLAA
jgi:hypothetical protein